jgi:hypothetical protein
MMSELTAALGALRRLPLCLHKNPAGTWSFVGSVPVALAYTGPADAIEKGRQFGFGFVKHLGVKARIYQTPEEALAAAAAIGIPSDQIQR